MANDTIFAVGIHELPSWHIEAGRTADVASVVGRKTFDDSDLAYVGPMQLSVSFNGYYHRILLIDGNVCFLHRGDIITQTTVQKPLSTIRRSFLKAFCVSHLGRSLPIKKPSPTPCTQYPPAQAPLQRAETAQ